MGYRPKVTNTVRASVVVVASSPVVARQWERYPASACPDRNALSSPASRVVAADAW